ncbi:MAG: DUF4169 family protein [Pseudomonadota bacterium]|nr:DUF4169 family protein [Pseudomonadota bacterium]
MAEPINLNKARKAKARAQKEQQASENRVKFSRTKAQKAADEAGRDKLRKKIDLTKRET